MAANVIDSLVVHLLLDVQQFIKAQRQAQQAMTQTRQQAATHAKSVEQQVRQVTETIGKLKTQALTLLSIFLGGRGIKEFAAYLTQTDAAVGRFSRAFNVPTEVISKWRTAVDLAGGSADEANESFANLSNTFTAFKAGKGDPTIVAWLNRLGVERLAPMNKQVEQLTKGLQKMAATGPEGAKDAFWFAKQVGIAPGMASLMLNPRFKELMEIAERIGKVSEEDAKAAEERLKDWREFLDVATQLGRVFATWLTPAIRGLTDLLERWLGIAKPGEGGEASTPKLRRRFGEPSSFVAPLIDSFTSTFLKSNDIPSGLESSLFGIFGTGALAGQLRTNRSARLRRGSPSTPPADFYGPNSPFGPDRNPAGAFLPPPIPPLVPSQHSSINHEIHIAQITVNTQAKDADAIARDISSSIRRHAMGMVVNSGLA